MSRLHQARHALTINGWQCERLPFDDAHHRYGPRVLPKTTPGGRQSVLDRLCVTIESWTRDNVTVLLATCEADTIVDMVCWTVDQPAVFTPSLKMVIQLAANPTPMERMHPRSGRHIPPELRQAS